MTDDEIKLPDISEIEEYSREAHSLSNDVPESIPRTSSDFVGVSIGSEYSLNSSKPVPKSSVKNDAPESAAEKISESLSTETPVKESTEEDYYDEPIDTSWAWWEKVLCVFIILGFSVLIGFGWYLYSKFVSTNTTQDTVATKVQTPTHKPYTNTSNKTVQVMWWECSTTKRLDLPQNMPKVLSNMQVLPYVKGMSNRPPNLKGNYYCQVVTSVLKPGEKSN